MNARPYMPIRITAVVLLLSCLLSAQQQEQKKEEKPAFQLETFYMAIMDRANPFDGNRLKALSRDRERYWQKVADRGDFISAGRSWL